jgi:hypothetical protein
MMVGWRAQVRWDAFEARRARSDGRIEWLSCGRVQLKNYFVATVDWPPTAR